MNDAPAPEYRPSWFPPLDRLWEVAVATTLPCRGPFKVERLMDLAHCGETHLRAMGHHLPYGITLCYLSDMGERVPPNPSQRGPVLDLPTPEGWKAELTYVP